LCHQVERQSESEMMMDPNARLTDIRRLVTFDGHLMTDEMRELTEKFQAMDEWLSKGGFPPEDWAHNHWEK
jgi:hypothetical protein